LRLKPLLNLPLVDKATYGPREGLNPPAIVTAITFFLPVSSGRRAPGKKVFHA
jgi:hypothetical protein